MLTSRIKGTVQGMLLICVLHVINCNARMSVSDLIGYVQHLPLAGNPPSPHSLIRSRNRRSATDLGPEMVGNVLTVFAPGLSQENKIIAENCMLFAELAAQQQVSRNESFAFFEAYHNILSRLGWYTLSSVGGSQMSSGRTVSFGREFLDIIVSLIERRIIPTAHGQQLIDDLKSVADSLEESIGGFYSQSLRGLQRNGFYVALVSQTPDGNLPIINFNAFDVEIFLTGVTAFWVKYKDQSYRIKTGRRKMTLNLPIYNRIKAALESRLIGMADQFIKEIDIATGVDSDFLGQ